MRPQGDIRQLDNEVWALLSNFSHPQFPLSSRVPASSSSSSSSLSSSSRRPLRNLSPAARPSGISSSVRPARPQSYSPGHASHMQVLSARDCENNIVSSFPITFFLFFWLVVLLSIKTENAVSKTTARASGGGSKVQESSLTD